MAKRSKKGKSKKGGKKRSSRKLQRYLSAIQAQQAAAQVPQAGQGGYINDAVPDSSTLLAYKLLKDSAGTNSAVFDEMLQNELKYLLGGIAILKNDAKIANEMGGESMANAAKLATLIKQKTKEIDWSDRIENMASDILYHDYSKPGKTGLAPQRIESSFLRGDGTGNVQLDYRISGATGHDIHVNRLNIPRPGHAAVALPGIAPRNIAPGAALGAGPGVLAYRRRQNPLF